MLVRSNQVVTVIESMRKFIEGLLVNQVQIELHVHGENTDIYDPKYPYFYMKGINMYPDRKNMTSGEKYVYETNETPEETYKKYREVPQIIQFAFELLVDNPNQGWYLIELTKKRIEKTSLIELFYNPEEEDPLLQDKVNTRIYFSDMMDNPDSDVIHKFWNVQIGVDFDPSEEKEQAELVESINYNFENMGD